MSVAIYINLSRINVKKLRDNRSFLCSKINWIFFVQRESDLNAKHIGQEGLVPPKRFTEGKYYVNIRTAYFTNPQNYPLLTIISISFIIYTLSTQKPKATSVLIFSEAGQCKNTIKDPPGGIIIFP